MEEQDPRFLPFETTEKIFSAVKRVGIHSIGGDVDNIHDVHANQGVHVPGCRVGVFDCFHMHWRWNGPIPDPFFPDKPLVPLGDPLVDVLVEPTNDRRYDPS